MRLTYKGEVFCFFLFKTQLIKQHFDKVLTMFHITLPQLVFSLNWLDSNVS